MIGAGRIREEPIELKVESTRIQEELKEKLNQREAEVIDELKQKLKAAEEEVKKAKEIAEKEREQNQRAQEVNVNGAFKLSKMNTAVVITIAVLVIVLGMLYLSYDNAKTLIFSSYYRVSDQQQKLTALPSVNQTLSQTAKLGNSTIRPSADANETRWIPVQEMIGTYSHTNVLQGKSGFLQKRSENEYLLKLANGSLLTFRSYSPYSGSLCSALVAGYKLQNQLCVIPHVVRVMEMQAIDTDEHSYMEILFEYGGTSLYEEMRAGYVTWELILVWIKQALECLSVLEANGMFLPEINLRNMVWRDGMLRFADLSSVKQFGSEEQLFQPRPINEYELFVLRHAPELPAIRMDSTKRLNHGKLAVHYFASAFFILIMEKINLRQEYEEQAADRNSTRFAMVTEKILRETAMIAGKSLTCILNAAAGIDPDKRPTFKQLLSAINNPLS